MYKISQNKRKYSTTPIVKEILRPDGKTEERFICVISLPKKEGDKLSEEIVQLLNQNTDIPCLTT